MSTITTIQSSDLITNSRADINTNFANLNSDKIETSVLDTDTALAANSDSKVATQKAVKAYVDAGGTPPASEITVGVTHSLTTTASQKVLCWVTGVLQCVSVGASGRTVSVKYNGVTQNSAVIYNENVTTYRPFSLMYTATPGAATANITVTTSSDTLSDVVIMVLKIKA